MGFLETLSELKEEVLIGVLTFGAGFMAHNRDVKNDKLSRQQVQEESKRQWFEVELETLIQKQNEIQDYLEQTIKRLEKEKLELVARIASLEGKIEVLQDENRKCNINYEILVRKCTDKGIII